MKRNTQKILGEYEEHLLYQERSQKTAGQEQKNLFFVSHLCILLFLSQRRLPAMDAAGSAQSAVVSAVNMCISLDFMRFVYYDDTGKRIFLL